MAVSCDLFRGYMATSKASKSTQTSMQEAQYMSRSGPGELAQELAKQDRSASRDSMGVRQSCPELEPRLPTASIKVCV
ncbi:hypothetical protein VTO73DRAFT_5267 [Trametes versicolor]